MTDPHTDSGQISGEVTHADIAKALGKHRPTIAAIPDGMVAGRSLADWMEFARRDDCLDRMVPSDLRQLIGAAQAAAHLNARGGDEGYIAVVPDHCHTIAWQGAYHSLAALQASDPTAQADAMAEDGVPTTDAMLADLSLCKTHENIAFYWRHQCNLARAERDRLADRTAQGRYPDDGGLKEPVRVIGDVPTVADILVEHFGDQSNDRT